MTLTREPQRRGLAHGGPTGRQRFWHDGPVG
jgi:hypothetical protein